MTPTLAQPREISSMAMAYERASSSDPPLSAEQLIPIIPNSACSGTYSINIKQVDVSFSPLTKKFDVPFRRRRKLTANELLKEHTRHSPSVSQLPWETHVSYPIHRHVEQVLRRRICGTFRTPCGALRVTANASCTNAPPPTTGNDGSRQIGGHYCWIGQQRT